MRRGARGDQVEDLVARPRLDEHGHEIPDPVPLEIPAGFKRPETLAEQVQRLVRTSISAHAAARGFETFDEAEDFGEDEEGDEEFSSPYETFFDPVLGKDLSPAEFRANEAVYRRKYLEAQREYFRAMDRQQVLERGSAPEGPREPAEGQPEGQDRGAGVSPAHARKAKETLPEKEPKS